MNHLEHVRDIGSAELFPLASEAILTWQLQEGTGVIARPQRRVRPGMVVDLWLNPLWPAPPLRQRGEDLVIPVGSCIVVDVIDTERQAGFVYRTRPGHLESGVQTFLVSIDDDDRLVVSITSRSLPGHPLLKAAAPLSVAAQKMMAARYAAGLERLLAQHGDQ
ncbi:DUF1990 family protein [Brevibacterium casei]|uniref:DUF1990 domain-containing protein n=1 Tax=Brevibacterium casei TaxID=33889 RepID=A0A7T2TJ33_9MICO|nr:DUF1990 domain-containing protein [Brevibacterium casei]QPS34787.1 DUF1990 domain-containing protein [Brevibacterium casei]